MNLRVSIFRKEHFNAAHRLYNKNWSDEKNKLVFGKCSSPNYHGHNYNLIVQLTGEINPETGFVYDINLLSNLIRENIIERFDHKNLNLDCAEFENLNPTAENIVVVFYHILRPIIPKQMDLHLKLYETENNIAAYPA